MSGTGFAGSIKLGGINGCTEEITGEAAGTLDPVTLDARKDPASRPGTCGRIGEQLGINLETLRG